MSHFISNDRLLNKFFAENLSLISPSKALIHQTSGATDCTGGNDPSFVVKVWHNDLKAHILFAKQIADWHLNIIISDIGGAGDGRVAGFDKFCSQALTSLDDQHANAENALVASPDCGDKVVTEGAIGDPLLGAIHNIELTTLG